MIQYIVISAPIICTLEYWMPAFAGVTAISYRNAEKRLSNEPVDATGAASGLEVGASAVTAGLDGGRAVATCSGLATLPAAVSVVFLGAACFAATAGRCGALRAGVVVFGLAGAGCLVVAVVSAAPKPILLARLVKMLFGGEGASSDDDGLVTSASGSNEVATVAAAEPRGGLTVGGMVPGAGEKAVFFRPGSTGSDSPV
jgi:hypothetical protein